MSKLHAVKPLEILLVEDDQGCAFLTRRAFELAGDLVNIHHVDSGGDCLKFLRRQAPYAAAPVPDIVLLDLEMPGMDGRQVMAQIAKDEALRHLAVVVLSSCDDNAEILRMYRLRCSSYICKPNEFNAFVEKIRTFMDYWFSVARLPVREELDHAIAG